MLIDVYTRPYRVTSDGILAVYDDNRSEWMSVSRDKYIFSGNYKNVTGPRYLCGPNDVASNNGGYLIQNNSIITSITVCAKEIGTASFQMRVKRGGAVVDIASLLNVVGESQEMWQNNSYDLQANDVLKLQMTAGEMSYPTVVVEAAMKITF